MAEEAACFGFYNESSECLQCIARKRCKAIMISDGMDMIAEGLLEELLDTECIEGARFMPSMKASDLVDQLLHPEVRQAQFANASVIQELFGADG